MATGFSAVRSGIVMFAIPFVFAFYPELLLVDQALIDPSSTAREPLPGYEDGIDYGALAWLLARLVLALYLVASALAAFDARALTPLWIAVIDPCRGNIDASRDHSIWGNFGRLRRLGASPFPRSKSV